MSFPSFIHQMRARFTRPDPVIPRAFHQTWKTPHLSTDLQELRQTWVRLHPEWHHRFWSDPDAESFVRRHYPKLLPLYEAYPMPVQRADMFRYLILYHFGGVYADVDFEALQAMDSLLEGNSLILGREPERHTGWHGKTLLLCNAWMAASRKHPFMRFVLDCLPEASSRPGALQSTGPFFLTECYEAYPRKQDITLLDPEVLYPVDSDHYLLLLHRSPGGPHPFGPKTFAMHYWQGSYWRPDPSELHADLMAGERSVFSGTVQADRVCPPVTGQSWPEVTCLMVTKNRTEQALLSMESFRAQTYPNAHLLIVEDFPSDALQKAVEVLGDGRIRVVRPPRENMLLGEVRQFSVEQARTEFICQWDDDDVYAPGRLSAQMSLVVALGADACLMDAVLLWWPHRQRMALSGSWWFPGSMLSRKSALSSYPTLARGEDSPVVEKLMRKHRVVLLHRPESYVYVIHGRNTFDTPHFEQIWKNAAREFEGADYARCYHELACQGLPMEPYLRLLGLEVPPSPVGRLRGRKARIAVGNHPVAKPALSKVLVLTPMRDVAAHLPRYFELLARLRYPAEALSLGILEGDSTDGTAEQLTAHLQNAASRFNRVHWFQRHWQWLPQGPRWLPELQPARRAMLARCRNELLQQTLKDEEWVLWIDADLLDYPEDVLSRLLASGKDIVAPHCVLEPGGRTFDMNSFRFRDPKLKDSVEDMRDEVYVPPEGGARAYLAEYRGTPLLELDGVGGTMLLVRADLHRQGLVFPVAPYRGYLETEGLAMMARDWGIRCWGLPDLEILHARQ